MCPRRRIDQLRGDAHPLSAFAHRAFEHIAHTKLAANPLRIRGLAFVGEGRIPRYHKQPADLRERGDDLLDHSVGKVFLFRIATHVLERQHRDRGFVGQRQCRGLGHRFPLRKHAEDMDRLADILERLLADIGDWEIELAARLGQHRARDADATGLGDCLQTRRDVDAVTVYIVIIDDYIAKIYPYAVFNWVNIWLGACRDAALPFDRAMHCIYNTLEFDK